MTRFTKFASGLTAAFALSLISAGVASADPGRGFRGNPGWQRDRVDVDIRSLQATFTPRGFAPGIEVSYRISAEDARRGESFNLQLNVIDCGRVIQTMVVPLVRGDRVGRDEVEFRGCVTIPASRFMSHGMSQMTLAATVTHCGSGRVLESERTSIRVIGPTFRDHGHGQGRDFGPGYGQGYGRGMK